MDPTPSQLWRRRVGVLGLAAVALLAVLNVSHGLGRVSVPPRVASAGEPDSVVRQERRLASLRRSVEQRGVRGTIGYVGDQPGTRVLDDQQAVTDYFQSQFVLAPLVLDLSVERRQWAVANLRATKAAARVPAGFTIVEDFGDGVLLLRKAVP